MAPVDVSAEPSPDVLRVLVSPWILLRICAIPYRVLEDAAPERTWRDIVRSMDIEDRLASTGAGAADAMHAVIPAVQDRDRRRLLLDLKRAMHAGVEAKRMPHGDEPWLAELPPAAKEWIELAMEHHTIGSSLDVVLVGEMDDRTRPAMRRSLDDRAFAHALALSAPRLPARLAADGEWNRGRAASNKSERTLMNYLARAAAKTSPLSTFMFNAFIDRDDGALRSVIGVAPDGPGWRAVSRVNRGVVARLARHARRNLSIYDDIVLMPNRSLRKTGPRTVRAIASTHVELLGRPWRQDRIAGFTLPEGVVERLCAIDAPVRWSALADSFAALGYSAGDTAKWMKQLLANGLVHPEPLWSATRGEPLQALRDSLAAQSSEQARRLADILARLHERLGALSTHLLDVPERGEHDVDACVLEANEVVGARFALPYQSNVSEFSWAAGISGRLGPAFGRLMQELGHLLTRHVSVSPEYARILELFVARYGAGGECPSLLDFIMSDHAAFAENSAPTTATVRAASIGVTTYVQLIAADLDSVDRGDAMLVANLLYERLAWQTCRYLVDGVDYPGDPLSAMDDWLRSTTGASEPVELTVSADCNGLQSHRPVTRRTLAWPAEGNEAGGPRGCAIDPSTVTVRHDSATNRLETFDAAGAPIALMYMGGVMPLSSWGPPYMLVKMQEPLSIERPYHLLRPRVEAGDVHFQERVVDGNIVMLRASWQVRAARVVELLSRHAGADRVRHFARFCRDHRIPRIAYVNAIIDYSSIEAQRLNLDRLRKPNWFDGANPVCLDLLRRLAESSERLVFREALPGPGQHWLEIDGERHVSELQVELHIGMH